jgi:hypothetical protein
MQKLGCKVTNYFHTENNLHNFFHILKEKAEHRQVDKWTSFCLHFLSFALLPLCNLLLVDLPVSAFLLMACLLVTCYLFLAACFRLVRSLFLVLCRHCEVRSNPVRACLSAFFCWIASLRSQ